jgi:Tol biopolymer transport system component/predicted Ser/Thr protein kinase
VADTLIGQVISHYRIVRKLGAGGMGEVYLAHDTALGRQVALKLLPPEHTEDDDRLRRFQQEARAASALNHPNIITIYGVDEAGGRHFIATEFVDGESLRALLERRGKLEIGETLDIAAQVASALAVAHEAGILHRDIKPENVMLRRDGIVKVLDFGLAKLLDASEPNVSSSTTSPPPVHTRSGIVLGTTQYMSPEQATAGTVDARSDIFAFGALLYESVTGHAAFQGDSATQIVGAILTQEPRPLSSSVPTELASLVLRCLRKDPERRFQTMAEVRAAIVDMHEQLAPAGLSWRRASVARWAALAVVVAVMVGGLLLWRTVAAPGDATPLEAVPLTTLTGTERYPTLSPDGDRVAFSWTGPTDNNPDIHVQQIGVGSPVRLTTDGGNDYNPVWSPDGRWIAFLRSQSDASRNEVRLIPSLGGSERKLAEINVRGGLNVTPPYLTWCPSGDCVIVTDSPGEGQPDALFTVSLETGEKRQLTSAKPPLSGDTHPAVSPDGRWLVFRRMANLFTGELYALPLSDGLTPAGAPRRLTSHSLDAQHPTWLPDSKTILFSARASLWRQSITTASEPVRLPFVGDYAVMPVVSRPQAGRAARLVYVRDFEDGNIWRITTSAPGAVASGPPVLAIASSRLESMPQFSPDARRVAFTSDRTGRWEIWVSDADGANPVQLTSLGAVATGYPHWSPDGEWITFHTNVDGQWEVYVVAAGGGKPRNLSAHASSDVSPSFSRDGRWIYFGSNRSGQSRIWKVPVSGGAAVQVTETAGWAPLESPDGTLLYWVETIDRPSVLWRMSVGGGPPIRVLDGVVLGNFAVLSSGIYYIDRPPGERGVHYVDFQRGPARLRYLDFASGKHMTVAANLGIVDLPLTVSPDGRTILIPRVDASVTDLMLVENFR